MKLIKRKLLEAYMMGYLLRDKAALGLLSETPFDFIRDEVKMDIEIYCIQGINLERNFPISLVI